MIDPRPTDPEYLAARGVIVSAVRLALRETNLFPRMQSEGDLQTITDHIVGSIEARHCRPFLKVLARDE